MLELITSFTSTTWKIVGPVNPVSGKKQNVLTRDDSSPKLAHYRGDDIEGSIVYLSPSTASGKNVCPDASKGCIHNCLGPNSGHGRFDNVKEARLEKTLHCLQYPNNFWSRYERELVNQVKRAGKKGKTTVCNRPNGTSDMFSRFLQDIIQRRIEIQFYDYTKSLARMRLFLAGKLPQNYHLTFSRSEENWPDCEEILNSGGNVAVVFRSNETKPLFYGESAQQFNVIEGDDHDYRFLDPQASTGYIVAIRAKGSAKKDTTGFVVDAENSVFRLVA